jgi:hypothetical protein
MTSRPVLQHFGMIAADDRVALLLQKPGGEAFPLAVRLRLRNVPRIDIAESVHLPPPLYRSHPDSWYWHQYLSDSQTLFVQYNECDNDAQHHFGEVARQALSATLVGEPTGGSPGGYGENRSLTLPNSKLVVWFTTRRIGPDDPNTLTPDIAAPLRLADILAGRDPAFNAAVVDGR